MGKRLRHKDRHKNDEIAKDFLFQDDTTINNFYIYKSSLNNQYGLIYYCSLEGDSWMLRLDDLMEAICMEFLERNNVLVLTTTEQMDNHEKHLREKFENRRLG
jgi:phage pi2 protein 07